MWHDDDTCEAVFEEFAVEGAHGEGGATYIGFVTFEGVFDGESVTGFGGVELRMTALV